MSAPGPSSGQVALQQRQALHAIPQSCQRVTVPRHAFNLRGGPGTSIPYQGSFANTGPGECGDALRRTFVLGVRLDRVFHDLNDLSL